MPDNTIPVVSVVHQLYSISPNLESPIDIEGAIEQVLQSYPYAKLQKIALKVNSIPGEAAERTRQELYRLLALEMSRSAVDAS